MDFKNYQVAATRTINWLGDPKLDLAHMALGFSSELGELFTCLNGDKKPVDSVNLMEELGDKMWYIANWCTIRKIELSSLSINLHANYTFPEDIIVVVQGNLADIAKRWLAYNNPPENQKNGHLEISYITEYVQAIATLCDDFDIDLAKLLDKNILKLYDRYPGKFTQDNALIRDLEKERKTLEA